MPKKKNDKQPNLKYAPVKMEGTFTDEDLIKYNTILVARTFDLSSILPFMDPKASAEINELQDQIRECGEQLAVFLTTSCKMGGAPTIKEDFDEEIFKKSNVTIPKCIRSVYNYIDNMDIDRKAFTKQVKSVAIWNDVERGNILEAMSEDLLLCNFKSQLSGAAPDIFKVDSAMTKASEPKKVLNRCREDGILNNLMNTYEAGTNLLELEIKKNKDKKTGWDASKEKAYLAGIYENYAELIRNVDELKKLPDDIQNNTAYLGNGIEHLTARGQKEGRSPVCYLEGAKWKMKAIENGWSADGLGAINVPGILDGAIQKAKYDYELKENIDKLNQLKEWEKKVFIPFKTMILSKKINSARDMIECTNAIMQFDKQLQNDSYIKKNPELISDSFGACRDVVLPKTKNRLIDALQRELEGGRTEVGISAKDLKKAEYSDAMKDMLKSIKNTEDPTALETLAAAYLSYKFLNGKVMSAHPELFDANNTSYRGMTDQLNNQCKAYAKKLISALKPENGAELADMLEYGDHDPYLSDIKDRIYAIDKRNAMEDFITGKLGGRNPEKSVKEVYDIMKQADKGVISTNSRFSDVMNSLEQMEKARQEVAFDLRKKNLSDGAIVPDSKKMKELDMQQTEISDTINSYLTDKEKKIRDKGGDPNTEEGIALLGRNGAKRYKAMIEARKLLLHSIQSKEHFKENLPTIRDREILQKTAKKDFEIDASDFRIGATYEMFKRKIDTLRDASISEYDKRVAENERFDSLKPEEKAKEEMKKAHENTIIESAKKSMYCDMTIKMTTDMRKELMNSAPKSYEHPKVSSGMSQSEKEAAKKAREISIKNEVKAGREFYKKSKQVLADISTSINDFVKIENGKVTINPNSEQLTTFENIVMKQGQPFEDKFKENVLSENQKGSILPSNISKIRDTALTTCIESSKDPASRNKFKALSEGVGSNAYNKVIDKEAKEAEAAKKAEAAKQAKKTGNVVKPK